MSSNTSHRTSRRTSPGKALQDTTIYQALRDTLTLTLYLTVLISLVCHTLPPPKPPFLLVPPPAGATPGRHQGHGQGHGSHQPPTAYEALGVNPYDDHGVIASAWCRRSEETHPDRLGHRHFEEYFEVQSAYLNIFDDPHRCLYDRSRGIRGLWADRYKECVEMALPYIRAQSRGGGGREWGRARERVVGREEEEGEEEEHEKRGREERMREGDGAFEDDIYDIYYRTGTVPDEDDFE